MKTRSYWFVIQIVAMELAAGQGTLTIAKDGVANADVVVSAQASAAVKHAAEELASFLRQVTNATFEIVNSPEGEAAHIYIGPDAARMVHPGFSTQDLGSDGIVIRTIKNGLILAGGNPRGTLYAVYTFLEDIVGCHWWSSTERTIPEKPTLTVPKLGIRYVPQFEYRNVSYFDAKDADYSVRNKLNGQRHRLFIDDGWRNARQDLRRGGRKYAWHKSDKWSNHSFYTVIPPEIYFAEHPDWFAEIKDDQVYGIDYIGYPNAGGKGKRAKTMEQCKKELRSLCLSNQAMRKEFVRNSRLAINWSPIASIFNVSQIDGMSACRCAQCMDVANDEGAYSGLMIRFVNGVASDLERFTGIMFDTLAYHYTRKPPKKIKPRHNVVVRLVVAYDEISRNPGKSNEISFSKPLTHERNRTFHNDLVDWSKICSRLFVYDYAVNFSHPIQPHPNLRVLGPNMRFYAEHNVKGFESEAHSRTPGTELAELRAWVLAKLAWNPKLDAQKLIETFCNGYYGPAGKHILAYIDTIHDAVDASGDWLHPGWGYDGKMFSLSTLDKSWAHLQAAEEAVKSEPVLRFRVRVARLPVMYVYLMRWNQLKAQAKTAGRAWPLPENAQTLFDEFDAIARKKKITILKRIYRLPQFAGFRR